MGLGLVRVSLFFLPKSGEVLVNVKEHSRQINDIQLSRDMTMFVTASKDNRLCSDTAGSWSVIES